MAAKRKPKKKPESLALSLLREVRDSIHNVEARVERLEGALSEHRCSSENRHSEILRAFPGADTEGHRRYHESVIEWRELRNKIVRECLVNVSKVGFVAGLGWLAYAIWMAFKMEVTK